MMLSDKTVVVTGAASGIGAVTVAELQRHGATVVGVDRDKAADVDMFHRVDLVDPEACPARIATWPCLHAPRERTDALFPAQHGIGI